MLSGINNVKNDQNKINKINEGVDRLRASVLDIDHVLKYVS